MSEQAPIIGWTIEGKPKYAPPVRFVVHVPGTFKAGQSFSVRVVCDEDGNPVEVAKAETA